MAERILIPAGGFYRIALDSEYDPHVTVPTGDVYQLICDGLVSDKQLVNVTGRIDLAVGTASAEADVAFLLKPVQTQDLRIATTETDLNVVRHLAQELVVKTGLTGCITVERVLDGAEHHILIATSPCILSGSVYTAVSDWAEKPLSELANMSLDDLIYKEV